MSTEEDLTRLKELQEKRGGEIVFYDCGPYLKGAKKPGKPMRTSQEKGRIGPLDRLAESIGRRTERMK